MRILRPHRSVRMSPGRNAPYTTPPHSAAFVAPGLRSALQQAAGTASLALFLSATSSDQAAAQFICQQ